MQGADWPGWRGPTRDGQAARGEDPPLRWSETENILWKTPIPGKGHGSPSILGHRIYLAAADAEEQRVVALDRRNGKIVWTTVVHRGKVNVTPERNSSAASATIAAESDQMYVSFFQDDAVFTTALDATGKILWQQRVGDFVTVRGFGSSPVVHGSIVLITADHKAGGRVAGLDKKTGRIVWQHERPKIQNYPSPAVLTLAGKPQLVIAGCNLVSSFDPLTGEKLWEAAGSTETTVTTPVTDGTRIFITGGFPKNHVAAVAGNGTGEVLWQSNTGIYVPSLLVRAGHVYGLLDGGKAVCWNAESGDERWREKVDRDFLASPVMAGNRIYATSQAGVTSVFEATPEKFTLIAQNTLGNEAIASPAIADHRLYLRHARTNGDAREEFLWCVGTP